MAASECTASSPLCRLYSPPAIRISPPAWIESSAVTSIKLPRKMVIVPSALIQFWLAEFSAVAVVWVWNPLPFPEPNVLAVMVTLALPSPVVIVKLPLSICRYAPALTPSPSAAMVKVPSAM